MVKSASYMRQHSATPVSTSGNANNSQSLVAVRLTYDYDLSTHDATLLNDICNQALEADLVFREAMRAKDPATEANLLSTARNMMADAIRPINQLNVSAGTVNEIIDFVTRTYTPRQYRT